MATHTSEAAKDTGSRKFGNRWLMWCCVALIAFALSAGFFIYRTPGEEESSASGWLPWLVLALCPLMHLFMHRGHGHRSRDRDE